MEWVLAGYLARRRCTRDNWSSPWPDHPAAAFPCGPPVEEICSVSSCIAASYGDADASPEGNPLGLFPDAATAWNCVPPESRPDAALYAYFLWPTQFDMGAEEEVDLWWDPAEPFHPDDFIRLGCDAVVGGNGHGFGCSPLSCNSGSDLVRCEDLNRYCLVGDRQTAVDLARRFSISQPEPGPYCAVEVLRRIAAPFAGRPL